MSKIFSRPRLDADNKITITQSNNWNYTEVQIGDHVFHLDRFMTVENTSKLPLDAEQGEICLVDEGFQKRIFTCVGNGAWQDVAHHQDKLEQPKTFGEYLMVNSSLTPSQRLAAVKAIGTESKESEVIQDSALWTGRRTPSNVSKAGR